MTELKDISEFSDIQKMVDTFYERIREDQLLGPIFNDRIQDRWDKHLDTMYRFWENLLLEESRYNGRPFPPHASLPIDKKHFDRWVSLFIENIDSHFQGPVTEEAKIRAHNIAGVFLHKILSIRGE